MTITHETVGDPYMERKLALANRYGATAANRLIAPMANQLNDAGMRQLAELTRRAANTPEASTLAQLARDNQMMQQYVGGDAFRGFSNMQMNASAFMQTPMGRGGPTSATARQVGGMNRAAAISNEIMMGSYSAAGGINKEFTQGLGQGELQDLAVHLAKGGAQAKIGDRVVSMGEGKTGAKDAAMMVSKYAKTIRTMMDTFGSRDVQEALKDYEKIVGHQLATKGDPGITRQNIDQVGSMASAMGMDARQGLQMFGGIRTSLAPSGINDVLYGRGVHQGPASARVMAMAMIRANDAGVMQNPEMMNEIVKEEVSKEKTVKMTTGARGAEMLAIMEAKGHLKGAALDRAKKALKVGDEDTFTDVMETVSQAKLGGKDVVHDMMKNEDKFNKWKTLESRDMTDKQAAEMQKKSDVYTTEAHNVQMMQKKKILDEQTTSNTQRGLMSQYGIELDTEKVSLTAGGEFRRATEAKLSKLKSEGEKDPVKKEQYLELKSAYEKFQRIEGESGFDAAVASMRDFGGEASIGAEALMRRNKVQRQMISGREQFKLGMRLEDVDAATAMMSPEEKKQMANMSPQERAKYAYDMIVKKKDAGSAEASKLAEKVVSQQQLDKEAALGQRDDVKHMLIQDDFVTADNVGAFAKGLEGLEGGDLQKKMAEIKIKTTAETLKKARIRSAQTNKWRHVDDKGNIWAAERNEKGEIDDDWFDKGQKRMVATNLRVQQDAERDAQKQLSAAGVGKGISITGKVEIVNEDGKKVLKYVDATGQQTEE